MNTQELISKDTEQEIDLIDLVWEWLAHWRSLLVCLLLGAAVAGALVFFGGNGAGQEKIAAEEKADALAELESNSAYWEERLSEIQLTAVQELADDYNRYLELRAELDNGSGTLSVAEKAEATNYVVSIERNIASILSGFSEEQQKYYYSLVGLDASEKVIEEESSGAGEKVIEEGSSGAVSLKSIIIKFVLCVFVAGVIHAIFVFFGYLFSKTVKHSDRTGSLLRCAELTRMVNWDAINNLSVIDRAIAKARIGKQYKYAYSEAQLANTNSINDIAKSSGYKSLVIVSENLTSAAEELKKLISKDNSDIDVRIVSGIAHSAADSKLVTDADAAVMLAKVGESSKCALIDDCNVLRMRKVDLIGVIVYE